MTYQLIYSSVSSIPMQQEELQALLKQAQSGNDKKKITGALVYVDGYFLQILEGEKASVQGLMEKISSDVRHDTVTILQAADVSSAMFSDWNMAYVSATPEQVADWVGFSTAARLPELFDDMRQNRHRAKQVANSILSVLQAQEQ